MSTDLLNSFGLQLPAGVSPAPLPAGPAGPFWQAVPFSTQADYADGLEELITDYNRQPPDQLTVWARQHPLTSEQRFILEYNTSADRANVLRALPLAATDRVLEVGCGCGPVSQYLWGQAQTLSLEASEARARAAAYRLAGKPNPHGSALLCADFHQLTETASFDWVIFNGVLEYAAIYSGTQEASPYVAMLKKAAGFLKSGGRCVVAIENQLGLKYFAGAPEDHYDRPAVGLEGYRSLGSASAPIRTFSQPALTRLLAEAGFSETRFQFPFPDYKFTKVLVPDDAAAWRFASERLIEPAPAWRKPRDHTLDEPAVFHTLALEGLAGSFANSFLAVARKPGAAEQPAGPSGIHYFPLKRDPAYSVGARFDLPRGEVRRGRLNGRGKMNVSDLPLVAPGNPRAFLSASTPSADGRETVQALSPSPSLWENIRGNMRAAVDAPGDYEKHLGTLLRSQHAQYLGCLPFIPDGSWPAFVAKLRAELAQHGLTEAMDGILLFLEKQQAFAEHSLAQMQIGQWSMWAPDWIMENLFPVPGQDGLTLFDLEYVDPTACLPTPVLAFRQLRVIQNKTSGAALRRLWPWPPRQLEVQGSRLDLPAPLTEWTTTALWGDAPLADTARHVWFWSKVAEVVECAITATVVAPFVQAYETRPWLEKLSAELTPLVARDLGSLAIARPSAATADTPPVAPSASSDTLILKEQQIRQLSDELKALRTVCEERKIALVGKEQEIHAKEQELLGTHVVATERLGVIQKLDLALNQARQTLAERGGPTGSGEAALIAEASGLRMQLAEVRRQLQSKIAQVGRLEREISAQPGQPKAPSRAGQKWAQLQTGWLARLAATTPHPLAKLKQYPPRPMRPERFPRPPRLREWPRICIATPSFQQGQFLERTMLSVLDQNYPNLAYGVQDGGSTDGSVEIITRHIARLAHAQSAPDKGQADAIRRGLAKLYPASNDIIGWLNSDDVLMPGALHHIGAYFARHPEVDVVYGHRVIIDEEDREIGRWFLPRHQANTLKWFDLVPQETMFWRARCYQDIGGLDESFQFALDWDLLLRFEQAGCIIRRLPWFLGCFRSHNEQKTSAKIQSVGEQEMQRLRLRTHEREVSSQEIHRHLTDEINRSAMVERLHRYGVRW